MTKTDKNAGGVSYFVAGNSKPAKNDTQAADQAAQIETLEARVKDLESQVQTLEANQLPEDALARVVSVDGIGDKLGANVMAALTAPAAKSGAKK